MLHLFIFRDHLGKLVPESHYSGFYCSKDDGGDNWSYKTCRALVDVLIDVVQSDHHFQQTNTQIFIGWMPYLSPNQQCQSTQERKYYIPQTPSSPGGLTVFVLTSEGTFLPWGGCQASCQRPDACTPREINC